MSWLLFRPGILYRMFATPHTAETLSTGLNSGLASFMNKAGSGKWDWLSTLVIMVISAHKPPKTLMATLTFDEEGWFNCEDIPSTSANPKPQDQVHNGGQVMTIVHTSGVHYLPVIFCGCSQAAAEDIQLFWVRLYPSTYKSCKTVFTFQLLDDYHLENLECKTLATHYYSKLRRITNFAFPKVTSHFISKIDRTSTMS